MKKPFSSAAAFAVLPAKEGTAGDPIRVDLLKTLLDLPEKLKAAPSFSLYGSGPAGGGPGMMRRGGPSRVTVVPGLFGPAAFRDDPRWIEVLANQGVAFLALEEASFLFGPEGLSAEGKVFVESLNKTPILLFAMRLDEARAKALLYASRKPFVYVSETVPGKELLDLIEKKGAALGLACMPQDDPAADVGKLDSAKKAVGTDKLIMLYWQDLWEKPGRDQVVRILTEMFKAKFDNGGLQNVFAGTLNRVMAALRPQASPAALAFMGF